MQAKAWAAAGSEGLVSCHGNERLVSGFAVIWRLLPWLFELEKRLFGSGFSRTPLKGVL